MLPSATNSDAYFLYAVWGVSLALTGSAWLMLAYVIILKIIRKRHSVRAEGRRAELSLIMHTFLNAPVRPGADALPPLRRDDMPIVAAIAFDMLRIIRGRDVERLIELLQMWKVKDYLRTSVRARGRGHCMRALVLLARFDDQESLKALFDCAADTDPYIQIAALRGIAARKNPAHLSYIVRCLVSSPNQRNILMLAEILKTFRGMAIPHLLELAKSQAALEVRLAAIHALAAIGSEESITGLIDLSRYSEADIRAQSLVALGKIGNPLAEETITRNLQDSHYAVRVAAAQAAGALGLGRSAPILLDMLKDSVWWVRYRAASALYQIGSLGIDGLRMAARKPGVEGEIAYQVLAEREGLAS